MNKGLALPDGPGCQPTASAPDGSSQSGIPNAEEMIATWSALLAEVKPIPFFASWSYCPSDHAWMFISDDREYVGAHPDFWAKIPQPIEPPPSPWLEGVQVHDLDNPLNRSRKVQFTEAMEKALGDFPQGDRSPEGGDGLSGSVHESAGPSKKDAPNPCSSSTIEQEI